MATLVLGAVGASVGGSLGGSALGLSSAVIGRAVGATAGRMVDGALLGGGGGGAAGGSELVEQGRIDRFRLMGASEGAPIPRVVGRVRVPGQVIWATRFREHRDVSVTETTVASSGGGKGGPRATTATDRTETVRFSYTISLALALCEGPIRRVGRIWADGSQIARHSLTMRIYEGTEGQQPDALMQAVEGEANAPAYRGTAYVVIEDLDLGRFGNRVPQLSFEVVRAADAPGEVPDAAGLARGVALVPGTGEYALATTQVHTDYGNGRKDSVNVNTVQDRTDFAVSLRDLRGECPNVGAASLVVSWFGNDLRADRCRVRPRVESTLHDGVPLPWEVAGVGRAEAGTVPFRNGRPIYGGTPSDASVVEAIGALASRGYDVTFYPFILMDQLAGSGLPNPWGEGEQPPLPWRGRVTTSKAPGREGSPDRTAGAAAEVAAFFGTAAAADFTVGHRVVTYAGPADWTYRRFILHYAALCAAAGGVEAFCIGSEMRGLTQIRGPGDSFPAVAQLVDLAREVRKLLPDAKLSYAADWSEYFGYHPGDTGNLHYHLDPLWAAPEIDFVAIDNYVPIADWRAGRGHADAHWGSGKSLDYLQANIEGGEGYDWYYATGEARAVQRRDPIEDGAHGEPWVWRYKDFRNWWARPHHERIGGVRRELPTAWVPRSKPIRFTELGCAAIHNGANQPNKFLDPKSSESRRPHHSDGSRDDDMQSQYLRAVLDYWSRPANNPRSDAYDGRMIDMDRSLIWAWDARPWPAFPRLRQLWNDAANFDRGHWFNGRSASQPLGNVIVEICRSCGLDRVDVSGVEGVVRGYAMSGIVTGRSDLQPLMLAHDVEAFERCGVLTFRTRSRAQEVEVDRERLVREGGPVVEVERAPEPEIAGRVRVRHESAEGAFRARVGEAVLPGDRSMPVSETEFALALTDAEGVALAERFLSEARIARDRMRLTLPPSQRDVTVGGLLRIAGEADLWRVDRLEEAGLRRVEATRVARLAGEATPDDAADAEADADVEDVTAEAVVARPRAPLPPEALILNLPTLTGDEVPHAPWVAVSARPWAGAVAVHSSVDGAGWRLNRVIDAPATIGTIVGALGAGRAGVWDRGPELIVEMPDAALASVSEAALFAGANAAAIGEGGADGWEILQFRDVRLVAPGRWALSTRLRGQRGTEGPARRGWPAGSRVVLLDGAPVQLDVPSGAVGLSRWLRIGPARVGLDHASVAESVVDIVDEGSRPFAPVHLRAERAGGELAVSWVRRTRAVGEYWDAGEVPLLEEREAYLMRALDADGGNVAEIEVGEPRGVLPAAVSASGGGSAAVAWVEVAQIGARVGPGAAARVAVS
jgi:hypothetical protein